MNMASKALARTRQPTIPLNRWLLSMPAALGLVTGIVLVFALVGAAKATSARDLEKRAALEAAENNLPAAAIDYRRLLQQFPDNAQFQAALASVIDQAKHPAQ